MAKGFLAIGVVARWHYVGEGATFRSKWVARLTEAEPTALIKDGQIQPQALAQDLTGFAVIVLLHGLASYANWRSRTVERLLSSAPTPVIKSGAWQPAGLRAERTRPEDVLEELRLSGEDVG